MLSLPSTDPLPLLSALESMHEQVVSQLWFAQLSHVCVEVYLVFCILLCSKRVPNFNVLMFEMQLEARACVESIVLRVLGPEAAYQVVRNFVDSSSRMNSSIHMSDNTKGINNSIHGNDVGDVMRGIAPVAVGSPERERERERERVRETDTERERAREQARATDTKRESDEIFCLVLLSCDYCVCHLADPLGCRSPCFASTHSWCTHAHIIRGSGRRRGRGRARGLWECSVFTSLVSPQHGAVPSIRLMTSTFSA